MRNTIYLECHSTETNKKTGKPTSRNAFYQLRDNADGTLTIFFGKIGTTGRKQIKPISEWNDILEARIDHGYKEVLVSPAIDPHADIRKKQLEKINIVSTLLSGVLPFDKRHIRTSTENFIKKVKTKLENKTGLLSAADMISLNDIYKKLKEK